jgi:hypothetical protein
MLNLLVIVSKVRNVAMFVTVNLQTIFRVQYVGMFIIYFHTKFHMPSSIHKLRTDQIRATLARIQFPSSI